MQVLGGRGRLLRALGMFALLAILFGSGAGFATSALEDSNSSHELDLPMPRIGDWAQYEAELIPGVDYIGEVGEVLGMRVEWQGETNVRTKTHEGRMAMHLAQHVQLVGQPEMHADAFYDARTRAPLAATVQAIHEASKGDCTTGICTDDGVSVGPPAVDAYVERSTTFGPRLGPCGFLTQAHGIKAEPPTTLWQSAHCAFGNEGVSLHYVGAENVGGRAAFAYSTVAGGVPIVWFANDLPFPIRFVTNLEPLLDQEEYGPEWVMTLTQFAPGTEDYPVHESVAEGAGIRLVPTTPWMLDDAGVDVPFPLSQAVTYLGNDVTDPPIGDWLAAHPGAYLVSAYSAEYRDGRDVPQYYWWLTWSDGTDNTARSITARPAGQGLAASDVWAVAVQDYNYAGLSDRHYPPIHMAPVALPYVADVLAEYERRHDPDIAPGPNNRYLYRLECLDASCDDMFVGVGAGYGVSRNLWPLLPGFLPGLSDEEVLLSELWVDGQGMAESMAVYYYAPDGASVLVSEPRSVQLDEAPHSAAVEGAWVLPSRQAAAGLGGIALLMSALYYLWPALKAIPAMPLFSRLSSAQILENPNRAQVMDLISESPGIHFQQIARRVGMGRGSLDHHLRKLTASGIAVAKDGAGYTCYFPKGASRHEMAAAGVTKSAGARALVELLDPKIHLSVRRLAEDSGFSPSTVSHHLARMRRAGLVEGGGRMGYRLVSS